MLKGGLPSWFNLSDTNVLYIRWFASVFTALYSIFLTILYPGPLTLFSVMFYAAVYAIPAAIISVFLFPTHRLRIFWSIPIISLIVFYNLKSPFITYSTAPYTFQICVLFIGFVTSILLPELRYLKRLFPSLQFVEKPLGANTDGAPGS
jgi:hypothetical protein